MFDKPAVLTPVDMQRGFDDPSWPRRWNADVDVNGLALLALWREAGWPIVHVRHDSVEPGSTLAPGQSGNAFRLGFEPRGGEGLVSKSVNSAFIGTDLDLRLRRLGVDTVVVFGITTDMCVSTTIRVGANLGYRMVMAHEACDCFDVPDANGVVIPARESHRVHVATLGFEFATLASQVDLARTVRGA